MNHHPKPHATPGIYPASLSQDWCEGVLKCCFPIEKSSGVDVVIRDPQGPKCYSTNYCRTLILCSRELKAEAAEAEHKKVEVGVTVQTSQKLASAQSDQQRSWKQDFCMCAEVCWLLECLIFK